MSTGKFWALAVIVVALIAGVTIGTIYSLRQDTRQIQACVSAGGAWVDGPGVGVNYECQRPRHP